MICMEIGTKLKFRLLFFSKQYLLKIWFQELASKVLGDDFKSPLKRPAHNGFLSTIANKLPRIESVPTVQAHLGGVALANYQPQVSSSFPSSSLASSLLKTTSASVPFTGEHENLPPIDGLGQ